MSIQSSLLDSPVSRFLERLPRHCQPGRLLGRQPDGSVAGDWYGCQLSSVFQPIRDAASGEIRGAEAFLRVLGQGRRDLSPWKLFSATADDDRLVTLDRLCRTVHLLNWLIAGSESLLFVNVHGRLLAAVADDHGRAFRRVIDALEIAPDRIVIETPAVASRQPDLLNLVLRNYRRQGFQVAANLDSPAQWCALASVSTPQFVKVSISHLRGIRSPHGHLSSEWEALTQSETVLVVTHNDRPISESLPPRTWLQGYAYGVPGAGRSLAPRWVA